MLYRRNMFSTPAVACSMMHQHKTGAASFGGHLRFAVCHVQKEIYTVLIPGKTFKN